MAERSKLFEEELEPDLSRFVPITEPQPAPALEQVRGVSAAAGVPNRDPARSTFPPPAPGRYYYRTGRDTQFNTKVRADVKAAFIAIAAADGIPIGKVLEDAL